MFKLSITHAHILLSSQALTHATELRQRLPSGTNLYADQRAPLRKQSRPWASVTPSAPLPQLNEMGITRNLRVSSL